MLPLLFLSATGMGVSYAWQSHQKNLTKSVLCKRIEDALELPRGIDVISRIAVLRSALPEDQFLNSAKNPVTLEGLLCAKIYLATAKAYLEIENFDKVIEMCRKGIHFQHDNSEISAELYLHLAAVLNEFHQYAEAAENARAGLATLNPSQNSTVRTELNKELNRANEHLDQNQLLVDQNQSPLPTSGFLWSTLFPIENTIMQVTRRLFQARSCFETVSRRFFISGLTRDIEGLVVKRPDFQDETTKKCFNYAEGGLLWNNSHAYTEAKVDLFAISYFMAGFLNTDKQQKIEQQWQEFCESSKSPNLLKARFYLKLSNAQIKQGNFGEAAALATTGLALNAFHLNNKLKARLYARLTIAQNRQSLYEEAIKSAQTGLECLSQSNFHFRFKSRLLTQQAQAYNKLGNYEMADATSQRAITTILAGLNSFEEGRRIDPDIELRDLELAKQLATDQIANADTVLLAQIAQYLKGGLEGPSHAPYGIDISLLLMQGELARVERDHAMEGLQRRSLNPVQPVSNKRVRDKVAQHKDNKKQKNAI